MGISSLNLSNPLYWRFAYQTTLIAATTTRGYYYVIPQYQVPYVFTKHTLLVEAVSSKIEPTWRLGFWLSMVINVAGIDTSVADQQPIRLGSNFIQFPNLSLQFKLKVDIPKWHQEMSIKFWEYTGPEFDIDDLLDKTEIDLGGFNRSDSMDQSVDGGVF